MAEKYGKPVTILSFNNDADTSEKIVLHEDELKNILLHPEVAQRKIVVVSVVGAFREGKSFLLDYMLRYMYANYASVSKPNKPQPNSSNDDWLGDKNEALSGFSWKHGSKRNTIGIIMWSDVFLYDSNNNKIAIILMDTQGLFDNDTETAVSAHIFSMSTLLSSLQIFNVKEKIAENQLEYLQFATGLAKFIHDGGFKEKLFQRLIFLVRDWPNDDEIAYGFEGGRNYLISEVMKIDNNCSSTMQESRNYISKTFDTIDCFLMPHPGLKVARNKDFNGSWADIDVEFLEHLKAFIPGVLSPDHLIRKKFLGIEITGEILYGKLHEFRDILNSDKVPNPRAMYDVIAEQQLTNLMEGLFKEYQEKIKKYAETVKDVSMLKEIHNQIFQNLQLKFEASPKVGKPKMHQKFLSSLESKIKTSYAILDMTVKQKQDAERFDKFVEETKESMEAMAEDRKQHEENLQKIMLELQNQNKELLKVINKPGYLERVAKGVVAVEGALVTTALHIPGISSIPGVEEVRTKFGEVTKKCWNRAFE